MAKDKSQPTRSRVTLIYDTGEREDDALERLRWVVPAVFLAASLILFFAVLEWFAPLTPILLFLGAVLVPVGGYVVWHTRGARPVDQAAAVALLATFGIPLLAWAAEPYRVAVIWAAGDLIPLEAMLVAAEDGADGVASRACHRVLASDQPHRVDRMRGALVDRPVVAMECLESLEDPQRGELVRISRHLRETWYAGWMGQGDRADADQICAEAAAYPRLADLHGADGRPTLLMCALGAPNEEAARCCGQTLSEHIEGQDRLAVKPNAWPEALQESLFLALAEAVDLPAATLLSEEAVDGALRWAPGDLFHWTSHLGCHLMAEHEAPDFIARTLSTTIDTQCGLDVDDPLFSFAAVNFVNRTCAGALSPGRSTRVDVVQWCDAAREANRETAVESARFLVTRALSAYGVEDLDRSIRMGSAAMRRQAEGKPVFTVDRSSRGRSDAEVGTDGVHLGRPLWADHTPESQERLRSVEEERERRRDEVRRNSQEDLSRTDVDRQVSEDMREELRRRRAAGEL